MLDVHTCSHCKEEKPVDSFYRDSRYKSGFSSWCKACTNARHRSPQAKAKAAEYYKANKTKLRDANKKWRESNRERYLEISRTASRRAYQRNPEKYREASRRWSQEHKDQKAEYARQWRAHNPEKRQAQKSRYYETHRDEVLDRCRTYREANREAINARQREHWQETGETRTPAELWYKKQQSWAREHGVAEATATWEDWQEVLAAHGHACAYCGRTDRKLDTEHKIPLARGGQHVKANLAPACRSCNVKKGRLTDAEFREVLTLQARARGQAA